MRKINFFLIIEKNKEKPILTRHVTFFFFKSKKIKPQASLLFSPHLISPSLNQTHDLHGRSIKAQHKPPTPLPWPKLHGSTNSCRRKPPLGWPHFPLPPTHCEQPPPPPQTHNNNNNHHHHKTHLITTTTNWKTKQNPYQTQTHMKPTNPWPKINHQQMGNPQNPARQQPKPPPHTHAAVHCTTIAHLRFDPQKPTETVWSAAWPTTTTTTTTAWSMVLAWCFKKNEEERKKKWKGERIMDTVTDLWRGNRKKTREGENII